MPFLMTDDSDRPNGLEIQIAVTNRTKSCPFSHLFLLRVTPASEVFSQQYLSSFLVSIQHRSCASSNSVSIKSQKLSNFASQQIQFTNLTPSPNKCVSYKTLSSFFQSFFLRSSQGFNRGATRATRCPLGLVE